MKPKHARRPKGRPNAMIRALHEPVFRARVVETKITKSRIRRKGCLRRQLAAAADPSAGSIQNNAALAQLARALVS